MRKGLLVPFGVMIGFLIAADAMAVVDLEVNAAILTMVTLLLVVSLLRGSARVPPWSSSPSKERSTNPAGVEAMATRVNDAAAGGYGSRKRVAEVLSSYAMGVGEIADTGSTVNEERSLVGRLVKNEPWAKQVFDPDSVDLERGAAPKLKGDAYLSALERALALVEKRGRG